MQTDYLSCPLDRFRDRELLHEDGRDNSVDNDLFIHAIHPRHVETVVLLTKKEKAGRIVCFQKKR